MATICGRRVGNAEDRGQRGGRGQREAKIRRSLFLASARQEEPVDAVPIDSASEIVEPALKADEDLVHVSYVTGLA